MVKIEFLQLFKSQNRIDKFAQTHLLKVGAIPKVGDKPMRIFHLFCRRSQVHPSVDNIPFDFFCEDKEHVSD